MKTCTIEQLITQNFNVIFINALKQFWRSTKTFKCIGMPKNQNLLLFLNGCSVTYYDKNGKKFEAKSNDFIYTPIGSEYSARLSNFEDSNSHTVGINFLIFDEFGEPIILSDSIKIFSCSQSAGISLLFHRALHCNAEHNFTQKRIILMQILLSLSERSFDPSIPNYITNSLQYMLEHIEENPGIEELAALSNISVVYFRKQFKKFTSTTPSEYRNTLRMERAQTYLVYGDVSVQEISDMLGYSSVSHFIKLFKSTYGCSPLQYRKLFKAT